MGLFQNKPHNDLKHIALIKATIRTHELEFENAYLKRQINDFLDDMSIVQRYVDIESDCNDPDITIFSRLEHFMDHVKRLYFRKRTTKAFRL